MARYRLRLLLQEFDLPPGETILGRSPECHVTIDDPLVSREHAKILVEGDKVILKDLGSRNGLKVNGQQVRGDTVLEDGDRIRIGNQEIVFSRVVAPRRPGRPTGSLRHCRKCQSPYMAEAPSCPNCGYGPGAEETLSGVAPVGNLDRETWSLQLQVELLDKALSLSRLADGDRVLGRIAISVDERISAGMTVEQSQIDSAFRGAIRLASAQGEVQWIRWVLNTLARMARPPSPELAVDLASVPLILIDAAQEQLGEVISVLRTKEGLDAVGLAALGTLETTRDRVVASRGPSTNVGGS
ncbi:MAG: FHA domain-containing protein [Polyangiales bacterium]